MTNIFRMFTVYNIMKFFVLKILPKIQHIRWAYPIKEFLNVNFLTSEVISMGIFGKTNKATKNSSSGELHEFEIWSDVD